jgi:hypothetical protein
MKSSARLRSRTRRPTVAELLVLLVFVGLFSGALAFAGWVGEAMAAHFDHNPTTTDKEAHRG